MVYGKGGNGDKAKAKRDKAKANVENAAVDAPLEALVVLLRRDAGNIRASAWVYHCWSGGILL